MGMGAQILNLNQEAGLGKKPGFSENIIEKWRALINPVSKFIVCPCQPAWRRFLIQGGCCSRPSFLAMGGEFCEGRA